MTTEELRAEIRDEIKVLRDDAKRDFSAVFAKLNHLASEMAGVTATLQHGKDRHGAEYGALFDQSRNHGERIASIEKSYLPRLEHDKDIDELKGQIGDHGEKIGLLSVSVGRLVAIASLIGGAAGIVGQIVVSLVR